MLELIEEQKPKLIFCKLDIEQRIGECMKSQIPSGKPRVFPFVGHSKNAHGNNMAPVCVSDRLVRRRRRIARISLQPASHIEKIGLFAPDQARNRLSLN